jgi:hypothetical protein
MKEYTRFSAHAGLAALGQKWQALGIMRGIEQYVHIKQKVLHYRPTDKLLDALISLLAGGRGVVDVNRVLRHDRGLQQAFGRSACADQSTISDTLNACTPGNVAELRQALAQLLRDHGQAVRHDYAAAWQVLDADLTGLPCGRGAEGATKGYFAGQKDRRGRQLGRVLASHYDEIVFEQLYPGSQQLEKSLPALITGAEAALALSAAQRARTIVRVDGGGGTETDINWLLTRSFGVLAKVHNWKRAHKLAASVVEWRPDPQAPERQVGWVSEPYPYAQPTRQVALRWPHPKKPGTWQYTVLVCSLPDSALFPLARQTPPAGDDPAGSLWAIVAAYDLRGGGVETANRGSKEGLQIHKRNKRCFVAQQMLLLLAELAYNLLTWLRPVLQAAAQGRRPLGVKSLLLEVLAIPGRIVWNESHQVVRIKLHRDHPWATALHAALHDPLAAYGTSLHLGQI